MWIKHIPSFALCVTLCKVAVVAVWAIPLILFSAVDVRIWPDKMQVRPGEEIRLYVTVSNVPPGQEATVECRIVHQLDTEAVRLTAKTNGAGVVVFTFKPEKEYGYEARATVVAGAEKAEGAEVFACAKNPWMMAPGYHGNSFRYWNLSPEGAPLDAPVAHYIANWAKECRAHYLPVTELMGLAYCPFSSIVPPSGVDNYFCGQGNTVYKNSVRSLRVLIATLHSNGVYSVVYANSSISGVGGTEFAREHPECLVFVKDGSFFGGLSTETLPLLQRYYRDYPSSLQDKALVNTLYSNEPGGMHICPLNFQDVALAEHGAQELIRGREFFGFDGVRYDGHYSVPAIGDPLAPVVQYLDYRGNAQPGGKEGDELTGRNMKRAMALVRKQYPDYMFGFNFAGFRSDQLGDKILESSEAQAITPGSYILDEVAKGADLPSQPEYRWVDFARNMSAEADRVRRLGGFLFAGFGPGSADVDTRFIKTFGWSAGVRWIPLTFHNDFSKSSDVVRDYNRFVYRYSEYILNNNRQRIPADTVDKLVRIEASRPIVYREFVYSLRTGQERYLMLNLVNAPLDDFITAKAQQPPRAESVKMRLMPDLFEGGRARPEKAVALSPDIAPQVTPLKGREEGNAIVVETPAIAYWMVVLVPY